MSTAPQEPTIIINVDPSTGELLLKSPFSRRAVRELRDITEPGRRFDEKTKLYRVPAANKRALLALLERCYPGHLAEGPKGRFTLQASNG
jgi:hypothetical protein